MAKHYCYLSTRSPVGREFVIVRCSSAERSKLRRLLDKIDRFIRVHQKTSFKELDETRTDTQL